MTLPRETVEARMAAFREACLLKRLRLTHQRIEVFRALASSEEHPDVESIHRVVRKRIPTISPDTIYRNLKLLAEHGLVQADLAGLDADLVNQAFAVGANPTNFTSVSLAVGDVSFGANSITGGLSLVARDGAQNATAVTRLNGDAALSLLSSTTLGGVTSALPASFNLANGTFESTAGATNATQFLRLKLAVPDVW